MICITPEGVAYRTPLHTLAEARAAAAVIAQDPAASRPAIRKWERRTKDPQRAYYVAWLPADPDVRHRLLVAEQAMRRARAMIEGDAYVWAPDPDSQVIHLVSASGEHYNLLVQTPGDFRTASCSCPDWAQVHPLRLQCKHILALQMGLGSIVEWESFPESAGASSARRTAAEATQREDASRAFAAENIGRDFPQ